MSQVRGEGHTYIRRGAGFGYAALWGIHGSQVRRGRAYIHTKGRWIRVCCPVGYTWVADQKGKGIPTYEGALDSGMLPCGVCICRRSEGNGIPTYEGALDSGMLPCGVYMGRRSEGEGHTYIRRGAGFGYAALWGMYMSQIRGEWHTYIRRGAGFGYAALRGYTWVAGQKGKGIHSYQGALDSGMLPCRVCVYRRSEGNGIHTCQ